MGDSSRADEVYLQNYDTPGGRASEHGEAAQVGEEKHSSRNYYW